MNRRSFIGRMVVGAASFAILPGAGRVWKAERKVLVPWDDLYRMKRDRSQPHEIDIFTGIRGPDPIEVMPIRA